MTIRPRKEYFSNTPFIDLLFNTLLGFYFLFAMAFLMINTQTKKADIHANAEYIITVSWESKVDDDIDIWLEDPLGNRMFFRKKDIAMSHLDRDDRGIGYDKITLGDGTVIEYPYNQEIATIRGFIPGEWILNLHVYNKEKGENDIHPTEVTVRMEKLNPLVKVILLKQYKMANYWEEITVARFTMNAKGNIINWSTLFKKVVRDNNGKSIPVEEGDDPSASERGTQTP